MRRVTLLVAVVLGVVGCGEKPKPQLMTPGTRLIYHGGSFGVFTMCDRGNRVYVTETGLFQVIAGGCPTGEP